MFKKKLWYVFIIKFNVCLENIKKILYQNYNLEKLINCIQRIFTIDLTTLIIVY